MDEGTEEENLLGVCIALSDALLVKCNQTKVLPLNFGCITLTRRISNFFCKQLQIRISANKLLTFIMDCLRTHKTAHISEVDIVEHELRYYQVAPAMGRALQSIPSSYPHVTQLQPFVSLPVI
jgi:hypothetical protein